PGQRKNRRAAGKPNGDPETSWRDPLRGGGEGRPKSTRTPADIPARNARRAGGRQPPRVRRHRAAYAPPLARKRRRPWSASSTGVCCALLIGSRVRGIAGGRRRRGRRQVVVCRPGRGRRGGGPIQIVGGARRSDLIVRSR